MIKSGSVASGWIFGCLLRSDVAVVIQPLPPRRPAVGPSGRPLPIPLAASGSDPAQAR